MQKTMICYDKYLEVEQDLFLVNANGVCHDIKTRDFIGNGTCPKMGRFSMQNLSC